MAWGGLVGNFPGCWQLCDAAPKAIKAASNKSLLLDGTGCGWTQRSLGCSICYQAWSYWPAFITEQVSRLALLECSFSFDLDTLEFPLLKKGIILICILFRVRKCWSLQGACCRESHAPFKVLAWGRLPLGSNSWVLVAFKQKLSGLESKRWGRTVSNGACNWLNSQTRCETFLALQILMGVDVLCAGDLKCSWLTASANRNTEVFFTKKKLNTQKTKQ